MRLIKRRDDEMGYDSVNSIELIAKRENSTALAAPHPRRYTESVRVGSVVIGGQAPVVVQSMTDTDTADIHSTVAQIVELVHAGSEIVRLTVDREESAKAVPYIRDALRSQNIHVPLVADFHFNGHRLLADYPSCAEACDKYRINPGNVGFGDKKDKQFSAIIETALHYDKAIRIGVNWGSLDQALLAQLMDQNARLSRPKDARSVLREALIQSALVSAQQAQDIGLPANRIVLSAKVSSLQDLLAIYRELSLRSTFPLHVGLTEAGLGAKGLVSSAAAIGLLLQEGIGDTVRFSLTPEVGGKRTGEVEGVKHLLQALGIRTFTPAVTACPGCGRTTSSFFRELAGDIQTWLTASMSEWKEIYPGIESLTVAVMGCIVNGPGESKHADIGISLPGNFEKPIAPVFVEGKKVATLRGETLVDDFRTIVLDYVQKRFGRGLHE